MKKCIVLFIFIGIVYQLHAQNFYALFAGPQATTTKYSIHSNKQAVTAKYGLRAGASAKIPFDVNLFFAPAAMYSYSGYKVKFTDKAFPPDTLALDNNTSIHTFELAFLLQYDLGKGDNHCFIKFGPSLDFQLLGKEKFNLKNGGAMSRAMTFNYSHYGRYGANALAEFGFETAGGLFFSAQYTYGLGNMNNADGGPAIHYRAYGLTVGKYLNRKKIIIDTKNKE